MSRANNSSKKRKIRETSLGNPLRSICDALSEEVTAAQADPSRSFIVTEGRCIYKSDEGSLYSFKADVALPIPPETPVILQIEGEEAVKGILVALQDFDVLIQLQKKQDDDIDRARISSEPWFINAKLRERLEELLDSDEREHEIPSALLGIVNIENIDNENVATEALSILRGAGKTQVVPNQSQLRAIARCAGNRLHFVWGPPGTGKTTNLAQAVRILRERKEKVLILAHANAAVDMAMVRVAEVFADTSELARGKILRIGVPQLPEARAREEILPESVLARTQPELIKRKRTLESRRQELLTEISRTSAINNPEVLGKELEEVRKELAIVNEALREAQQNLIKNAFVLGATLSRLAIDDLLWNWCADAIMIDETSMAPFPSAFGASFLASKRMLFFGDFRQLPPIFLAKSENAGVWLGRDAFEVAGVRHNVDEGINEPRVTMLEIQHRMSPEIACLVSELAYGGKLRTADDVSLKVEPIRHLEPWIGDAVILVNSQGLAPACFREPKVGSFSRVNPVHGALGVSLAGRLLDSGCRSVGIINPYRAQARLFAAMIRHLGKPAFLSAATVHRFQGSERDAIIVDLVDAPRQRGASTLTGQDKDAALRLINVAISRARGKLIVIADEEFLDEWHPRKSPALSLIEMMRENASSVTPDAAFLRDISRGNTIKWYGDWGAVQESLVNDLSFTNGPVYMNLEEYFLPSGELVSCLDKHSKLGNRITIFAGLPIAELLEETQVDIRLLNRPGGFFALIDGRISYVGGYLLEGGFARFDDAHITDTLSAFNLGSTTTVPSPSADSEATLSKICGRCIECGEERRPRKTGPRTWIIRCPNPEHPGELITLEILDAIGKALKVLCPVCNELAVAKKKGESVFWGCPNYRSGCRGKLAKLEDIFGGP